MNCYEVKTTLLLEWEVPLDSKDYRDPAHIGYITRDTADVVLVVWADTEADALAMAEAFDYDELRLDQNIVATSVAGITLCDEDERVTDCSIEIENIKEPLYE